MLQLKIVSPEKVEYDGMVESVLVPGTMGQFEILTDHAPIISSLGKGTVEYATAEGKQQLQVSGGFVAVQQNEVSLCIEVDEVEEEFFETVITTSIAISVVYTILATLAFVAGYRAIRHSERALTLYGLVAMALRMLSAVLVVIIFLFIVEDSAFRRTFIITFSVFYLLMLIFDVWFYIRSQKK